MFKKLTTAAAATAICASSSFAGGLSPEIVEAVPMEEVVPAPTASINPTYLILGVIAVLLIASAGGGDDEEEEEEEERKSFCDLNPSNPSCL